MAENLTIAQSLVSSATALARSREGPRSALDPVSTTENATQGNVRANDGESVRLTLSARGRTLSGQGTDTVAPSQNGLDYFRAKAGAVGGEVDNLTNRQLVRSAAAAYRDVAELSAKRREEAAQRDEAAKAQAERARQALNEADNPGQLGGINPAGGRNGENTPLSGANSRARRVSAAYLANAEERRDALFTPTPSQRASSITAQINRRQDEVSQQLRTESLSRAFVNREAGLRSYARAAGFANQENPAFSIGVSAVA